MSTGDVITSIPKYKRRSVSAVRDFPPGCGPNAPRIAVRNPVESKFENDDRELPRSNEFEIADFEASSVLVPVNLNRKFPPRRKVSAIRDFPPLCGTKAVCKKSSPSGESEKGTLVGNGKEIVVYDPEKNGTEITDEDGVGKEIVVRSEACESRGTLVSLAENSGKMVTVYALKAASSCEGLVSVSELDHHRRTDFSPENNRVSNVTVYALMAAPNCPWRQREGTDLTSHRGFPKARGLKPKHGSSGRKKSSAKKLLEERRAMKAGLNKGKAISKYIEPSPLRFSRPYATATEGDELDSGERDEECDDFYAGLRTREINLPPLVPKRTRIHKDSDDHNKVREALLLFQAVYNRITHENEENVRRGGTPIKRIDSEASKFLDKTGKFVNTAKVVGPVPGVDIGLEFQYREELRVVGLHRPPMAGIDYMNQGGTVIATSIVASGGYDDDMDSADVLNYSGSGGNPPKGGKTFEDQKLERGNLALMNSIAAKNPVRVIRGHDHKVSGRAVKTYTYDGLYVVTKYWQERGPNGNLVYMFRLERIPGQPELAWNLIKNSKKSKVRHGLCMSDISEGKEPMPICAYNTVDDQKPPRFMYITKMRYPDWCQVLPLQGCDCVGGCSDSESCLCAVRNGGEIPYNYNGSIVEAKPLVYECGPSCKCPPSCPNRVSQSGIKFQLEIFKTESRGWGVRSMHYIPSGSFICEYLGELLEDKQAEQKVGSDEYLFDIGQNFIDENLSDKFANSKPHLQIGPSEVVDDGGYSIDAERYGNIGRFINHSCSPNLYAQNVLYDHEDWRIPHIMLFAAKNISPLQELTYHYNYSIGEVRDANGNVKTKSCFCGSADCTGRLY